MVLSTMKYYLFDIVVDKSIGRVIQTMNQIHWSEDHVFKVSLKQPIFVHENHAKQTLHVIILEYHII